MGPQRHSTPIKTAITYVKKIVVKKLRYEIPICHARNSISFINWGSLLNYNILWNLNPKSWTMLVVFSIEPVYEATATILIESEEENVISIEEVYGIPGANDEYFETQNQILQSRDLAEKVISVLDIPKHPEFDPELQEPGPLQTILSWLPAGIISDDEIVPDYAVHNSIVGQFRNEVLN